MAGGGAVYNLAYGDTPGGPSRLVTLANSILADSNGGIDLFNHAANTTPAVEANVATVTATGPNLIRSTTANITARPR